MLSTILAVWMTLAPSASASEADNAFEAAIEAMKAAVQNLTDATFTFHKQEYVGGLQPAEIMNVKWRRKQDVYLSWAKGNAGREVIYREGWNDNKLKVKPSSWLPVLDLHPKGRLAMHGQRHAITDLGLASTVRFFAEDLARVKANPDKFKPVIRVLGRQVVQGDVSTCFHAELPKDIEPAFYGKQVKICIADRTQLPTIVQVWNVEDGELRLVEDYIFANVVINSGLGDAEFDPQNEKYGF
jgi:hypothetical protein